MRGNFLAIEQVKDGFRVFRKIPEFSFVKDLAAIKTKKIRRLALILDAGHAATVQGIVRLKRFQPAAVVKEDEVDQAVSRAFWEFLNRYRNWSAKKLGWRDSDLVLADIGIIGLEIGGKKVFNPVGFRGADFSFQLKGTFVSRETIGWLDRFRGQAEDFFIIERGGSFFNLISPRLPNLIICGDDQSLVFGQVRTEIHFRREIPWGYRQLLQEFEKALAVDEETARGLMKLFVKNLMSEKIRRFSNQIWQEQFEKLRKQIGSASPSFIFDFELPAGETWVENFRRHSVASAEAGPPVVLAAQLDSYRRPEYNYLNQLLKRRARWLIPNF